MRDRLRAPCAVKYSSLSWTRCLSLIFLAGGAHAQSQQATIPVKQADAVCTSCHAKIFNEYLSTPMANASGLATDHLIPGVFIHSASGVKYRVFEEGGAAWLSYDGPDNLPEHDRRRLDYFLGSGHLGITYLYSVDGYLLESPVAYYSSTKGYDMGPGLGDLREMPTALPTEADCLRCHMSGVKHSDLGTINHYSGVPFLYGGITCEACHGDTRTHVLTRGKASVVNPAKLDPERRDSVCISCHLEGDISVEKDGRSAVDFIPGDAISDYLSYFVYARAAATARGVSEVEQFSASMCKRAKGDKMSCTSCHNPHYTPPSAERVTFYRGKCLACHSDPGLVTTHHPENPDCTSCHMPRSNAKNIPHVAWTDHRILRQPEADVPDDNPDRRDTLVPIFSPSVSPRDLALAYYIAAMNGKIFDHEKAFTMLTAAYQNNPNNPKVLGALGMLAETRGDSQLAASLFRDVLKLAPEDLKAASNLAVLQAKGGNLQDALTLLQPVFNRNQDSIAIARNLAAIECILGDRADARNTIETALKYSPGSEDLKIGLRQTSSCAVTHAQ